MRLPYNIGNNDARKPRGRINKEHEVSSFVLFAKEDVDPFDYAQDKP